MIDRRTHQVDVLEVARRVLNGTAMVSQVGLAVSRLELVALAGYVAFAFGEERTWLEAGEAPQRPALPTYLEIAIRRVLAAQDAARDVPLTSVSMVRARSDLRLAITDLRTAFEQELPHG